MKYLVLLFTITALTFTSMTAQDRAPSPAATTIQKVGLTDITVEYSRPGLKGRTAFADGSALAPLGKMWRTGANSATKITFSEDVKVGGKMLAAGSYAITTVPSATQWTVNFYPHTATRWSTYQDATPAASVMTEAATMDSPIESFMISFDEIKDYSAVLIMGWANTIVPVTITVN